MKDGALALGSTKSESLFRVQFFAALPGIVGGILLAISRAIGETMIVFVAAGASPTPISHLTPWDHKQQPPSSLPPALAAQRIQRVQAWFSWPLRSDLSC